jgi:glycosyltransferase involved in cell wall biosynthesis
MDGRKSRRLTIELFTPSKQFDHFVNWLEIGGHTVIRENGSPKSDISICFSHSCVGRWRKKKNPKAFSVIAVWDFHPKQLQRPEFMLLQKDYANADMRIVPSKMTQDDMKKHWKLDSEFVIYPILPIWRPDPFIGRQDLIPYVMASGRIVPHKHMEHIIQAIDGLDVNLIIADPQGHKIPNLPRNVFVEKIMDYHHLLSTYHSAELFISATSFEGLGITPLESIFMGTPIIHSRMQPAIDWYGDTIEWFEIGDVQKIRELIINRKNIVLGNDTRDRVMRFLPQNAGPKLLQLICRRMNVKA